MKRLIELDMLRGYALVAIMIDHMPRSVLRKGTIANWSVFDAAELFVLLSGFLVGLVWLRIEARDSRRTAQLRFARRSFEVWRALLIGAVIMALLSAGLLALGMRHTAIWNGYAEWVTENPAGYIIAVGVMWLQPNLVDVLAVYVILLASAPLLVPVLLRWPVPFAIGSVLLWYHAPQLGPMVPNFSPKGILFNPFGWQMLFYSGIAMGLFRHRFMPVLLRYQGPISFIATLVFCFGAAITLTRVIGEPALPLREWLKPLYGGKIDKWSLDGTRYLAILAGAWLITVPFLRPIRWLAATPPGVALQEIGRGGLWSFICCVLLSVLGDAFQLNPPDQTIAQRLLVDIWVIAALWYVSRGWRLWTEWRKAQRLLGRAALQ